MIYEYNIFVSHNQGDNMNSHKDLSILTFEDKVKLMGEEEKARAGELIDRIMAERRRRRLVHGNGKKPPLHKEEN
jgi:hypothetical protein